jgi:hypothetical protein
VTENIASSWKSTCVQEKWKRKAKEAAVLCIYFLVCRLLASSFAGFHVSGTWQAFNELPSKRRKKQLERKP